MLIVTRLTTLRCRCRHTATCRPPNYGPPPWQGLLQWPGTPPSPGSSTLPRQVGFTDSTALLPDSEFLTLHCSTLKCDSPQLSSVAAPSVAVLNCPHLGTLSTGRVNVFQCRLHPNTTELDRAAVHCKCNQDCTVTSLFSALSAHQRCPLQGSQCL